MAPIELRNLLRVAKRTPATPPSPRTPRPAGERLRCAPRRIAGGAANGGLSVTHPEVIQPRLVGAALIVVMVALSGCGSSESGDDQAMLRGDTVKGQPHAVSGVFAQCDGATAMAGGLGVGHLNDDDNLDLVIPRLGLAPIVAFGDGSLGFTERELDLPDAAEFYGAGVAIADFDGNGQLDVAVASVGPTVGAVWLNDGERLNYSGTLSAASERCRVNLSPLAIDVNDDGALDLVVPEWRPRDEPTNGTTVLLGDGTGRFSQASNDERPVGLLGTHSRSIMGLAAVDLDGDGATDAIASADWNQSAFQIDALAGGVVHDNTLTDTNGMGLAVTDLDLDGRLDVFISSIGSIPDRSCTTGSGASCTGNRIYEVSASGSPVDTTDAYGARHTGWGWGAVFADLDVDGIDELVVANGMQIPGQTLTPLMGEGVITEPTGIWIIHPELRTQEAVQGTTDLPGKAIGAADLDRDGDLDIIHIATNSGALILENTTNPDPAQWLGLELPSSSWPDGVDGLHIWLRSDTTRRSPVRTIQRGGWFQLSAPESAHFGFEPAEGEHDRGQLEAVIAEIGTGRLRCVPISRMGTWLKLDLRDQPECAADSDP